MKTKIENNEKQVKMSAKQLAELLIVFNAFYKKRMKEKYGKQK